LFSQKRRFAIVIVNFYSQKTDLGFQNDLFQPEKPFLNRKTEFLGRKNGFRIVKRVFEPETTVLESQDGFFGRAEWILDGKRAFLPGKTVWQCQWRKEEGVTHSFHRMYSPTQRK
jgi:hypothetical protein